VIYIALSYKHILYIKVAYINCLASSLSIFIGKTPVFNFSTLSSYLSINRKLYYSGGLSLNENIDLTSIGL
jgi:hypothetical protein